MKRETMKARRIIQLGAPVDEDLRGFLAEVGAFPHVSPTTWIVHSDAVFATIEAGLAKRDVPFTSRYDFQPSPGEDLAHLAACLTLEGIQTLDVQPGELVLACDNRTLATVASEGMVRLLRSWTFGTAWDPLDGYDGFFVMTMAAELPEPVFVPHPTFLSPGTNGNWAVQSDGRELLTAANLQVVTESGVAVARYCSMGGRVLPWVARTIFAGRILAGIQDNKVRGIVDSPVFLGNIELD